MKGLEIRGDRQVKSSARKRGCRQSQGTDTRYKKWRQKEGGKGRRTEMKYKGIKQDSRECIEEFPRKVKVLQSEGDNVRQDIKRRIMQVNGLRGQYEIKERQE
jgi:hypothetical protein